MKIAPQWDWRAEVVKDLVVFGPENWIFLSGPHLKSVRKTELRPLFFFLRSPNLGWKNRLKFGEDPFFFLEIT